MRVSAALAWRFLAIIAALYVIIWLTGYFAHLMIPLAIALLLAALMAPGVERLTKLGVPRGLSAALVLIAGIAVVGGLLTFVIVQFTNGLPELQSQVADSLDQIGDWLKNGPLHLRQEQIQTFLDNAIATIKTMHEMNRGDARAKNILQELLMLWHQKNPDAKPDDGGKK